MVKRSQKSTSRDTEPKKRSKSLVAEENRTSQNEALPPNDKHERFTQWSRDRGVEINNVKPAAIPGRGIGLVTTAKIKKGVRILFVPEKAMFKPLIREQYQPSVSKVFSPQAQLALRLAIELKKPDSDFQQWRDTWPTFEDFLGCMPMMWNDTFKDYLPKSTQQPLQRQDDDYLKDFKSCMPRCDALDIEENDFTYCWAIVNSRSFHFKPAGAKPGYMVLCPFIDYMNHTSSGSGVKVSQTPQGYEVVADRAYDEGEEILATYGGHNNDKLLVHYGFLMTYEPGQSTDDDIRLDDVLLPALNKNTQEDLQHVGFLGGYALLPETNELCFKTQVAVRAQLLTANEWEYFISNGEDLSGDKSAQVNQFVAELLWEYQNQARKSIKKMTELEESTQGSPFETQAGLVKMRWKQIRDAVTAFLNAIES